MIDLEKLGREMPYRVPDHFMDKMTERVLAEIDHSKKKRGKRSMLIYATAAVGVAAMATLLLAPLDWSQLSVPDYDNISKCKSIDELFGTMSAEEIGVYSIMANYYGE